MIVTSMACSRKPIRYLYLDGEGLPSQLFCAASVMVRDSQYRHWP
jgi:hypothetical protein